MKNIVVNVIVAILIIAGIIVGFSTGIQLDELQLETLKILGIVVACSAAYCFIVGEISRNNSQMDKIWSLIPIAYVWIIAAKGGMKIRLVVMAVLVTIWGIRLTVNFALKGAYSIKFWAGEEDYRWSILRARKPFSNKLVWGIFDLLFISIYQNALVLMICLPMVMNMSSEEPFGIFDIVAAALMLMFIVYETIADKQQMDFHTTKKKLLAEGKKLEELPSPYCRGFNTTGLWSVSRHPNYLAEQAIWICFYLFCIGAKVTKYGIFNWTIAGCLLLVFLFMGSSALGEAISASKYPEYKDYQKVAFKYLPVRKYK